MKFLGLTLINHTPDPVTGRKPTATERFDEVVDNAVLFEELGFDAGRGLLARGQARIALPRQIEDLVEFVRPSDGRRGQAQGNKEDWIQLCLLHGAWPGTFWFDPREGA